MALTTPTKIKTHLGISGSSEDATINQWIVDASAAIETHLKRRLGGAIESVTVANPAVVTSRGHGLSTGDKVYVDRTGSATLDGLQTITYTSDDTFNLDGVDNSAGATATGVYGMSLIEYYMGDGTPVLLLRNAPVFSITNIWLDGDGYFGVPSGTFDTTGDVLVDGEDYALKKDDNSRSLVSKSGIVYRIKANVWPGARQHIFGRLADGKYPALGNIKAEYVSGFMLDPQYATLLASACAKLVGQIRMEAGTGGPMQSESLDYYSYSRLASGTESTVLSSLKKDLAGMKKWVW